MDIINKVKDFFVNIWLKLSGFFKDLWDILSNPLSHFADIFSKLITKITGDIGKQANNAIWSFADKKNRDWYKKHSTKLFIGITILIGGAIFGFNYALTWFINKDLCIDPKTGNVIKDDLEHPIKLKDVDCPYNIPEGMCQDPETLTVFENEFGEKIRSDSPACPSSTFDQDGGISETQQLASATADANAATAATNVAPAPTTLGDAIQQNQGAILENTATQAPTNTTQAVSDFREQLRNQSGGKRRRRKRKKTFKNSENLIKTYKKYLKL
jgi:hypothetical protein